MKNTAAPLYNAALSTMWLKNFNRLDDFCQAARRLGFAKVELNYEVNSTWLDGFDPRPYRISSLHEPCPADISVETLRERDWLISAEDEDKRRQGVAAIRRSIELARRLGASAIVIHAGNVQADNRVQYRLDALERAGQRGSAEYHDLQEQLRRERAAKAGPRLAAVKQSLRELLDAADGSGIRLGIENRDHYMEIPILEEMDELLALAGPERLGMIYDVGHARALDRLGYYPHEEWLRRYGPRLVGTHLHDVIGQADHHAPGLGEVDYRRIAPYLPADAFRTLELRSSNTPEQVQAALGVLAEAGCIQLYQEVA